MRAFILLMDLSYSRSMEWSKNGQAEKKVFGQQTETNRPAGRKKMEILVCMVCMPGII
jgi:tryptophanase